MHDEMKLASWKQQWGIGRYLLLGTVIATVVNILLLIANISFFIPYYGALPFYLTYFGYSFDYGQAGTYTLTGFILALPWLAVCLLMWWRAKHSVRWLVAGLVLLIADTAFLAIMVLMFAGGLSGSFLQLIFHGVVIYEVIVGIRAKRALDAYRLEEPAVPEEWDIQTPAESEYTDTL